MLIDNPNSLSEWLINYLEPICDADPQALAKYILALIKKDKTPDELKKICLEQLEVFLVNETNSFVDTLFETLNNKSYLISPNSTNNVEIQRSKSPKSRNVPAPSGSTRRQHQMLPNSKYQQSNKYQHDSSSRSPTHNSRQSPLRNSSPNRKRRSRSKSLGKNFKRNRSRSPASQQDNYAKMRRCRDYDEKGYCMRGNLCSYDHGVNPVILDPVNANSVLGTISTNTNKTNASLLLTSNNQYTNSTGNKQASVNNLAAEQYNEPYNPEAPAINQNFQNSIQYRPTANNSDNRNNKNNVYVSRVNQTSPNDCTTNYEEEQPHNSYKKTQSNNQSHFKPQNRNQFRANNNKRNKSQFLSDSSEKTTLEVRKIPSNLNTIANLNEHFSKYGTITNLKIGFDNDPEASLVEFASNNEALAAYRSTEAVLNNRFIKVFWHNSGSSNMNTGSISSTTVDQKSHNVDGDKLDSNDKIIDKKLLAKERLGGILAEKQATITNNVVNSLLNSGLINSNTPNQLASLIVGTNNCAINNKLISSKTNKPVFNPALLRKQYTPASVNTTTSTTASSTDSSVATNNSTTITASTNPQTQTTKSVASSTVFSSNIKAQPNKEKLIKKLELQKKRQEMLSTSIQQNRLLIEKLEKAKTEDEKIQIRETITILTKQIKQLEEDIKRENSLIKGETNLQKQAIS